MTKWKTRWAGEIVCLDSWAPYSAEARGDTALENYCSQHHLEKYFDVLCHGCRYGKHYLGRIFYSRVLIT